MSPIRFRIRTTMIVVALAAALMCLLRFALFINDLIGFDFLFFVAVNLALFVFVPIVTIVETLFFVGYFGFRWWRRVSQMSAPVEPEPGRLLRRGD
jgi:hypothetical protein